MKLSTKWTLLALAGIVSGGAAATQKGKPKPAAKETAPQNGEAPTSMKQDTAKADSLGMAPSDTSAATQKPKGGKASCKGHSSCKGMGGCGS